MKRCISFLAVFFLVSTLLCGCGGAKLPSEADGSVGFKPTMDTKASAEININGSWSNFEALEAVVRDWNKIYPNVAVNYTKIDDFQHNAYNLAQSDEKPDMMLVNRDGYWAEKEKLFDSFADLSEIGMDMSVVDDIYAEAGEYNGKFCIFNWGMQTTGFAVNKTILEKFGLDIPKTADEFMNVCAVLTQNGYVPIQNSYKDIYSLLFKNDRDYRICTYSDKDALLESFKNITPGCGEFFKPEFEAMIEIVQSGYTNADINNGIENAYEDNILNFLDGKTAFLCLNTESFSGIKKRESKSEYFSENPFEYEFAIVPLVLDEAAAGISPVNGFSVISGSKNEEWAKEFLRFLCRKVELNKIAYVKGVPPVTKDEGGDSRYGNIQNVPDGRRVSAADNETVKLIDASFNETISAIGNGKITGDNEAAEFFEDRLREHSDVK